MEGRKPGRSGRWLECCLSEPHDMVHPGPDSSDGCASGTDQLKSFKGEHLLAAAQTSMPRNRDDFSSTDLVEIPAGASGWSLVRTSGWMLPTGKKSPVCFRKSAVLNK